MWDGSSGCINVSIAENRCVTDLVLSKLRSLSSSVLFHPSWIYYQDTRGMEGTRRQLARYLKELTGMEGELDEDSIIVSAGCNAVLETLFR